MNCVLTLYKYLDGYKGSNRLKMKVAAKNYGRADGTQPNCLISDFMLFLGWPSEHQTPHAGPHIPLAGPHTPQVWPSDPAD